MESQFKAGDKVQKVGGDYIFVGHVVSVFPKVSGAVRMVVEDDRGVLHVYSEKVLKLVEEKENIMSNVFKDQSNFMRACDQSVTVMNEPQYAMYKNLIEEEFKELQDAFDMEAELDALIDILVVTIGAIHSAGFDGEGAWKEVMRSNFSKVSDDGKVRKREDGKILKPIGYSPPDLTPFLRKD